MGNIIYASPIILGYIETFLFISLFCLMYLMHFEFKYNIFDHPNAYQMINNILLGAAMLYSVILCVHAICAIASYHQCKQYEVLIRHFKRSLYSNKHFSKYCLLKNEKERNDNLEIEDESQTNENENMTLTQPAPCIEMYDLDISESDDEYGQIASNSNIEISVSHSDDAIMDRWQWNETYKEQQQNDFLSILNPSNNSFAFVAYQRWLNVKKLELENDSFTRSKSALVLNTSKYWLTSYFTLIIILIFVVPNSVYLYFAFVLTLFVMYYCYLRTIKKLAHSQALKKVLYLFCSFVIGTIITLIIIFTTEDGQSGTNTTSVSNNANQSYNDGHSEGRGTGYDHTDAAAYDNSVTFWIFDIV